MVPFSSSVVNVKTSSDAREVSRPFFHRVQASARQSVKLQPCSGSPRQIGTPPLVPLDPVKSPVKSSGRPGPLPPPSASV